MVQSQSGEILAIYTDGSDSIYQERFSSEEELSSWLDEQEYKAIVVRGQNLKTEDHT